MTDNFTKSILIPPAGGHKISDEESKKYHSLIVEVFDIFAQINPAIKKKSMYAIPTQRKAIISLFEEYGYRKTKMAAQYAVTVVGQKYAPSIHTPYELLMKFSKLIDYYQRERTEADGTWHLPANK